MRSARSKQSCFEVVDLELSRIPPKELCKEFESESIVVKNESSSHRSCQTNTLELHS